MNMELESKIRMASWQIRSALALILTACIWGNVMAAGQPHRRHVAVDLIAEKAAAVPGTVLTVAVRERIEPDWHTYWTNPGDSGEPTSIAWTLPEGYSAGPILWPLPHIIEVGPLAEYGFDGEILLLTDIRVPQDAKGSVTLAAKVSYLVCKDICVPEAADVQLTLPVATEAEPSVFAQQIASAREALPVPFQGSASYAANPAKGALRLTATAQPALFQGATDLRFFPLTWGPVSNTAAQPWAISGGELTLDLQQGDSKETPEKLEGLLVLTKGSGEGARKGYIIAAARGPDTASAGGLFSAAGASSAGGQSAAASGVSGSAGLAVLFAFLGGIILNLMPCVFPVLALKALSFAKAANSGHKQQGLAYLGGVLVSFLALAAAIAVLREGSVALGWGFQFQSPAFVLALALLFFLMGLSLSGAVSFGGGLMAAGDSLARKPGNAGYFFTGMLAAVAATPCTAPFMGAAIGYAMTQPSYILVAVMLGLGLGFAAPFVALSFSPHLQKILPKPGAWMETLKQVLAFPLYVTAAWLVWILSIQAGSDGVMAAALALVGIGFAAWLANKTASSSLPVKLAAPALGVLALVAGLSLAMTAQTDNAASGTQSTALKEEPFTQSRLDELTAQGRPVFVNLTAAWCITCKVNERVALRSTAVVQAFQAAGIAYLKGDWTTANPEITALLEHFGRAGVPLYLFYPGQGAQPRVLPQLLTAGLVLDGIKPQAAMAVPSNKGA
jgi:thiol:disulfide interchange protein/DsbC/DsbD-like thiol-disulfide interchange protein